MEYGFFDNQLIGVDALNSITSKLVSGGIARTPSSVSDLNDFMTDVVTSGIVPESDTSLQVSVQDNVVNISPGTAFFENGTFSVLKETETLTLPEEFEVAYIYLISSMDEMRVFVTIETSERQNENGDYCLLLATINTKNEVADYRKYAKGKAAYYGSADINNNVDLDVIVLPSTKKSEQYVINVNPSLYESIILRNSNNENLFIAYLDEDKILGGYERSSKNSGFGETTLREGCIVGYYNGSIWRATITKGNDNIIIDFTQDDFYGGPFSAVLKIKLIAKKV